MAELPLSVVKALLCQLNSEALAAYARINGFSDHLPKWQKNLVVIQAVMDSAEERLGDTKVDLRLDDLREVAHDMKYLLHLFSAEAEISTAFKADTRRKSGKLTSLLIIPCCSKMVPRPMLSDHLLAKEIEEVDLRLEKVIQQKALLGLAVNYLARRPTNPNWHRLSSTSLPEQIEKLLARLTGGDLADNRVPFTVYSIVGMKGLGKTSLAQKLYNHEAVCEAFPVKAWTCVSNVFDSVAITKSILQCVDPHIDFKQTSLDWLQNMLKDRLQDELWSLLDPFRCGANGSRILLTTRSRRVAELAGDHTPLALDLLSMNESLSLLAYRAIGEESFENRPHLQDIAVRLAKKCGGLPLAVKMVEYLLRSECNDEKWKEVLDHPPGHVDITTC